MSPLVLSDDTLAFFVDDTGHEQLAIGHTVFGLAGCAVMAPDLERLLRSPWREVRKAVAGSPDHPLHAARFGRDYPGQMDKVAAFFRGPFFRFGAVLTTETVVPEELHLVNLIARVLGNRIVEITALTPCRRVAVVFESSQRSDPMIEKAFSSFSIRDNDAELPVEFCFMEKRYNEPGLEVADFVANAVGGHARKQIEGKPGLRRDFQAIFCSVDRRLSSFMLVTEAQIAEG